MSGLRVKQKRERRVLCLCRAAGNKDEEEKKYLNTSFLYCNEAAKRKILSLNHSAREQRIFQENYFQCLGNQLSFSPNGGPSEN